MALLEINLHLYFFVILYLWCCKITFVSWIYRCLELKRFIVIIKMLLLFHLMEESEIKNEVSFLSSVQGPIYKYGDSGKNIFGSLLTPNQELWLVDWLEHSCKLVGWVRFNGFILTQQCTTNIACIVETVYTFNLNYYLKTK